MFSLRRTKVNVLSEVVTMVEKAVVVYVCFGTVRVSEA
jgi:hypothetical protein